MADTAAPVRGAFAATGIVVEDLDRSVEFYRSVLGMEDVQRFDVPDMQLQEVVMSFPGSRGAAIVLMHYTDGTDRRYVDVGGKLVLTVPDPGAVVEAARTAGCEIVREPEETPGFGLLAFAKDPDGHTLELLQLRGA